MTTDVPANRRALGAWMATALIVGNTIGMGIFVLPASLAPFGLNSIIGWIITLIGFLFIAAVLANLSRAFPQDDGVYSYANRAFGEATAFLVLWGYWVATWVTNATLATGVVNYLSILIPGIARNALLPPAIALGLVWFFVLINLRGARTVGRFQVLTTALKLMPLVAVIALAAWQLQTDPSVFTANVPETPISLAATLAASTTAIFALLGVECASVPAGRIKDPRRTIPRATMIGTAVTAFIYIAVSTVPLLLIPQAELETSAAPFSEVFSRLLGPGSAEILAVFVVISGLGALNGWTLVVGEVTENFARHGSFPRGLAKVNSRQAPTRALLVTATVASIMLLTNYNQTMVGVFTFLSLVVTAANLPLYFACALAIFVLWRRGELQRNGVTGRRVLVYAVMATVFCLWAAAGMGLKPALWALGLIGAGVTVYAWAYFARRRAGELQSATP
jgi:APA family basic amino acid/polyamine antiporter